MYFPNTFCKNISKNLSLIGLMTIGLIDESNYLFIKSNALIFLYQIKNNLKNIYTLNTFLN